MAMRLSTARIDCPAVCMTLMAAVLGRWVRPTLRCYRVSVVAMVVIALAAPGGLPTVTGQHSQTPRVTAAAVNATTGGLEAQTTAGGSFTDSLPIQVPAFHGLEPHISLDYDSANGNGEVGVGWRLTVGSTIVRSGPNGALPRYDASDVFLVDGEELVPCAPHCITGGTHETRRQSFERYVY
jgi:hypothetical protein